MSELLKRLDIGAGTNPFKPEDPEWQHLDARQLPHIEHLCNMQYQDMPFPDNCWDELRAYSILEHVTYRRVPHVVKEWFRILKPGGMITIVVPYIDGILRGRAAKLTSEKDFCGYLGGEQDYAENFHIAHFDRELLATRLIDAGFVNIQFIHAHNEEPLPDMDLEMRVRAYKNA